jgi:hypothetical protein
MEKRILITPQSHASHGGMYAEPPVSLVKPGHTKVAETDTPLHPYLQDFIKNLKPKKGETWVLLNAMGCGEYYGDNINGDYFSTQELVYHDKDFLDIPIHNVQAKRAHAKRLGKGYPTFYDALAYKHHKNKNPDVAFGTVECAIYNPKMKRIELIERLDHERCKKFGADDILHRLECGEYPATSMGTRVKWDVCSVCGNKAKQKSEYCVHIKDRRINKDPLGNGTRPYMINIRPIFFDNSFVFVGADRTAGTLMKIANQLGDQDGVVEHIYHDLELATSGLYLPTDLMKVASNLYVSGYDPYTASDEYLISVSGAKQRHSSAPIKISYPTTYKQALAKVSELRKSGRQVKLSDVIKYVLPNPNAKDVSKIEGGEPDLPEPIQKRLEEGGLEHALSSTARAGIVLKPKEFTRIILISSNMPGLADESPDLLPDVDAVDPPCDFSRLPSSSPIDGLLHAISSARSIREPFLGRRSIRVIKIKPVVKESRKKSLSDGLLCKISSAYNAYRLWLLAENEDANGVFKTASPDILSAFAGGDTYQPVTNSPLTSSYLQRAFWRAGGNQ